MANKKRSRKYEPNVLRSAIILRQEIERQKTIFKDCPINMCILSSYPSLEEELKHIRAYIENKIILGRLQVQQQTTFRLK